MSKSSIEWTQETWNPIVGCSIVSPGCTNCYAMAMAARIEAMGNQPRYDGTTRKVNGNTVWTGKLAQAPVETLLAPLKRKKPTTYFVNSMGDLFHEDVPDEWIDRVFAVMALSPQHTFQVLTKRAARMRDYFNGPYKDGNGVCARIADATWSIAPSRADLPDPPVFIEVPVGPRLPSGLPEFGFRRMMHPKAWPLPNVWLGVSTERQQEADERIPLLLQTLAAVRFISAEPLLGPIDLTRVDTGEDASRNALDWAIVGGESGPNARPMSIQWAREMRDQCKAGDVAFFFKQWGEWAPAGCCRSEDPGRYAFGDYEHDRSAMHQVDGYPRQFAMFGARSTLKRVGKKSAGRLLDGIEHNGMPERP